MAGIDILDLVEATEVNETTDYLAIVDKSDTSQDVTGSTKKVTVRKLLGDKALPSGDFVGTTDTQTITHKTISTSDNTFSGMLDWFYPVGTIYETTSSDLDTVDKVNAHFGGTWEFYGAGRVLVAKSTDTEFDTIGKTGGAKSVTLTSEQSGLPEHTHNVQPFNTGSGVGYTQKKTGSNSSSPLTADASVFLGVAIANTAQDASEAHNNLQPYIVVYRYRRIS